jgi:uncharacterized phage infection (PIP) family protein YhgE
MSNPSEWGASGGPGKRPQGTGGSGNSPSGTSTADLSRQGSSAVREGAREVKEQASTVAESAKGLASQAGEKLLSSVEEQKAAGADFVSGMAGAIRRAANEFDKDVPQAAQYIRLAAAQIDTASDAFRRRDLNQLVSDVQGFARRQPTAFLGAAVLAGFAVVRFLKTSTAGAKAGNHQDTSTHHGPGSRSMPSNQPGEFPSGEGRSSRNRM